MTESNADRTRRLADGRSAPVVRIESDRVTVDGEQLPLLVAAEPIETRVDPMGAGVVIRLSLLAFGPVLVDQRSEHERNSVVDVHALDEAAPLAPTPPAP